MSRGNNGWFRKTQDNVDMILFKGNYAICQLEPTKNLAVLWQEEKKIHNLDPVWSLTKLNYVNHNQFAVEVVWVVLVQ